MKRRVHMSGPCNCDLNHGWTSKCSNWPDTQRGKRSKHECCSFCMSFVRQLECTTQPAPNTTRRLMSWGERHAARFMLENMRSTVIEQPYGVPRDTHAHMVCCRNGRGRVWIAACRGQAQVIARLVDEGADVNECDK